MSTKLDPLTPAEAKEMSLDARKREVAKSTVEDYHYRLKQFIRWCKEVEEISNLNELTGRDLQRFKTWRRDDGDLKPVTTEITSIRSVSFCVGVSRSPPLSRTSTRRSKH